MTKANQALGHARPQGNSPPIKSLSQDEVAAALLAMLSGSEMVPPRWQLKAIVAAKADSGPYRRFARVTTWQRSGAEVGSSWRAALINHTARRWTLGDGALEWPRHRPVATPQHWAV
jgi:hypothetical protein